MKICIITHEFPPTKQGGGQGTYAMNLVRELLSKNHSVTVIAPNEGGKPYENKGSLTVHRLKVQPNWILSRILFNIFDVRLLLSRRIKKLQADLNFDSFDMIHVLDMHDSYFINNGIKTPVITSVNDYYSLETPWNIFRFPYPCSDIILRYIHYNFTKVLNCIFLKKASHVISDTKYTAEAIKRVAKVIPSNVSVIYKGLDLSKYSGTIGPNKYTNHNILYVGGNMERKGVVYLVEAIPQIIKKYPDAKLTIIGWGNKFYLNKLNKIIKSNKIEAYIEHIKYCPPSDTPKHFEKANVFVLPSVIEDLGQVLIESMASKTPVVTTNVGANPEAIIDQKTGLLVDPKNPDQIANAIIRIFSYPRMARNMGENGRYRAEKMFSSERMLNETISIYEKVSKLQ